jgi:hypothetical protein
LERYIDRCPAAADTVDGIARWWLADSVPRSRANVEAALDRLVQRGVLSRGVLPDGHAVYGRAALPS